MYGWMGKRLRIDLTNQKAETESLSLDYLRKWIGGRGLNSCVVCHETRRGLDPFDPENPLCFGAGPLNGTFAPLSGRTTVSSRSPMTCSTMGTDIHGHGDTNMGGHFSPAMKYAGYDQLIIKGRAPTLTYLWIDDENIEFRDARHIEGFEITPTTNRIIEELGGDPNIRVAAIGPAGEKLVRFACIVNSYGSSGGRTGMGAVMGSKNLKAIAIRGTHPIEVADPKSFADAAWALRERIHNSPSAIRRRDEGSLDLFDAGNSIGINANKNCSTGYMKDIERIYGGYQWAEKYLFRRKGCWSCPVSCGRTTYIKEGKYAGFFALGPEMETLCNLGPRIDSTDVDAVNVLCGRVSELGMDSISGGGVISWLMECFEKGRLSEKDTEGITFRWADTDTALKVLEMTARREGIGDLLAEGTIRVAEKLGAGMDLVPHVRGLEEISVDSRVTMGFSLGYAMSTRGSDHLKNYSCLEFPGTARARAYQMEEALGPDLAKEFWKDFPNEMTSLKPTKPALCTWSERNKCVADLVGCCCQAIGSWGGAGNWREAYAPLLRYATGIDFSDEDIFKVAERVIAIERAHWNREGSGRQDDTHPERRFTEPVVDGPYKGSVIDREEWAWAQSEYYRLHGWDEDGFITSEKAKELGIEETVPDIEKGREIYKECIKKRR